MALFWEFFASEREMDKRQRDRHGDTLGFSGSKA